MKLNETPVRTARNFNINNINLEDFEIQEEQEKFNGTVITGINPENEILKDYDLKFGVGERLVNEVKTRANQSLRLNLSEKTSNIIIENKFDKENSKLIDNIEIIANEGTSSNIIIKYRSYDQTKNYHNSVIRVRAKMNSKINITIVNLLNTDSDNFLSIENELEENAEAKYTIVDFGGKNSITNYYSNLLGKECKNSLDTIYLGRENQVFDLNYIGELRGEKSEIEIEVQGALRDNAKKHFKGTIDFKRGAKKAKGNENEFCMLLSDTAKSIALPMLLCSEEEVEGNHSSAAGKIDNKTLFYIMSRGLDKKEAMKLAVKAKFNNIMSRIKDEALKNEIMYEIDSRLN